MNSGYVHGYLPRETLRLHDQANALEDLLHFDTVFRAGSRVLEVGCGVGAQTIPLALNSPGAFITSLDISSSSIAEAVIHSRNAGVQNVRFCQADVFNLPFDQASFDHVFVCFVLEHLASPVDALRILKRQLRPGGTITVIEGDHGSAYFYPESEYANKVIQCQVDLQRRAGGNAMIGRALYPILWQAGFRLIHVTPRMVYTDSSKPELVEEFTKNTFNAMIEGIRDRAIDAGLVDSRIFDQGVQDLYRTAGDEGVFCYTFFKATASCEDEIDLSRI
jgi:ubiquinone/menaquinone biosynthesis C-methylase UbiE